MKPKTNLKILWYCTKEQPFLYQFDSRYITFEFISHKIHDCETGKFLGWDTREKQIYAEGSLNGKIVAESDFEVEEITRDISSVVEEWYSKELLKKSCLTAFELDDYLNGKKGYAIHIKNLEIFDKPKELKDLYIKGSYRNLEQMFTDEIQINGEWFHPMARAPQNMCYAFDRWGNKYVVISVRPEWLCLILNGLKDVELRRKVLKEMKE